MFLFINEGVKMPKSNHPKLNILPDPEDDGEGANIDATGGVSSSGGDVFSDVEKRIRTRYSNVDVTSETSKKFMHGYNEVIHIAAPIIMTLVVGIEMAFIVLGQSFVVSFQTVLGVVGAVISVMVVEAIGLSITFQLALAKKDMHQATQRGHEVKANYSKLRIWRIGLTVVEALGQAAFLGILFVADHVNFADLSSSWIYIFLVLVRTIGLFVADFYPAFLHISAPTTAQNLLAEDKMQSDAVSEVYKATEENLRIATRARREMLEAVNDEKEKMLQMQYSLREKEREFEARERRQRQIELDEAEDRKMLNELKRQKLLGSGDD
jgi:hypothetical protein